MVTDNKKRAVIIKRIFYMISTLLAISALVFVYLDSNTKALILAAVIVVWFFVFTLADFQFVQFGVENGKLILRYYPIVKFGRKEYSSIEFPVPLLKDYIMEKAMFGLVTDLTLLVKTRQGIAEYPSVSLAAVSKVEREQIKKTLDGLLGR